MIHSCSIEHTCPAPTQLFLFDGLGNVQNLFPHYTFPLQVPKPKMGPKGSNHEKTKKDQQFTPSQLLPRLRQLQLVHHGWMGRR